MSKDELQGGDLGKDKDKEAGELTDADLEQAQGGKKTAQGKTARAGEKNRALFRTLDQDMLFRRIEERGWNR